MKGGKENAIKGRQALERAIEIDPTYAPAVARLADSYNSFLVIRYTEEWGTPALAELMLATAARAVALDPGDAYTHVVFGNALTQLGRHDEAVVELERALRLNSNDVDVLQIAAAILFRSGFPEKAVELGAKRMELDPFQSPSGFPSYAKALFLAKNYAQAVVMAKRCEPTNTSCILTRIAAAGQMCQAAAGKAAVADLLKLQPNYTVHDETAVMVVRWRRKSDIDHFADGLRKAGLPE
ncbi:MAG: tetratricopeptide repeat protein [Alphaproteobacteria bacterium]|nr:tetratricopeptide repeat protein [Alphaproteobacteria bacterium]